MAAVVSVRIRQRGRVLPGESDYYLPDAELRVLLDALKADKNSYPQLVFIGPDATLTIETVYLDAVGEDPVRAVDSVIYTMLFETQDAAAAWAEELQASAFTFPFKLRRDSYKTLTAQAIGLSEKQMMVIYHIMHDEDPLSDNVWFRKQADVVMRNHESTPSGGFVYFEFPTAGVEATKDFVSYVNAKCDVVNL